MRKPRAVVSWGVGWLGGSVIWFRARGVEAAEVGADVGHGGLCRIRSCATKQRDSYCQPAMNVLVAVCSKSLGIGRRMLS